jgi:regulator of replication initiation timing
VNLKNPAFHRRMEQRRSASIALPNIPPAPPRSLLNIIGHLAQIALAIVAIFGYFYTVRPVYQKDRLAEQVAEYEAIIKEQKPKALAFEKQLISLSEERNRLNAELASIEKRLSVARAEKKKIENQIQFMAFRYYLPDGKPATTHEQVQAAQDSNLAMSFVSGMNSLDCLASSDGETVFHPLQNLIDRGRDIFKKTEAFPFTRQELKVWAEQGARFPLTSALICATRYADSLISKYSNDPRSSQLIANLKGKALREIKAAGSKPWMPPIEPAEIINDLASKKSALQTGTSQVALEHDFLKKADAFRESIHEEITRLLKSVRKDTLQ